MSGNHVKAVGKTPEWRMLGTVPARLDTGEIHRAPLETRIAELEAQLTLANAERDAARKRVGELEEECAEWKARYTALLTDEPFDLRPVVVRRGVLQPVEGGRGRLGKGGVDADEAAGARTQTVE